MVPSYGQETPVEVICLAEGYIGAECVSYRFSIGFLETGEGTGCSHENLSRSLRKSPVNTKASKAVYCAALSGSVLVSLGCCE